jgi:phytoene synthase
MKRRDTNFYYAFLVLPPEKREAIVAVWDFCRAVDDAADEPAGDAATARAALAMWRAEVAALYDEGDSATPQGRALRPFVGRFGLPRSAFEAVVEGVELDLDRVRYQTFDQLREYCLRVASAVGLICLEIFGYRDAGARQYAIDLGIALQLTNIVRDVAEDLSRGRIYLPEEDLARFGCTADDLARGEITPPVRALLAFEAARAREFFARARASLPRVDRRSLVAGRIMDAVYFALLRRIERRGYNVFAGRVTLPRWRKASIAARVWLTATAGL